MPWASLAALLGGWALKFFTFETAKYLATRALLILIVMTLGPIVYFKGFCLVAKFLMTYGKDILTSWMGHFQLGSQVVQLTGVGGYLASYLRIGEGISLFMSFLTLKFIWNSLSRTPFGMGRPM